ncbi:glutaredoxin domain-containing protein [Arthrobacter sulfonylureivorans]|uniref:glutaredoxin domain-containing protein n=1 Tax=Arthrobacter sulfonylureivorans TaxID=2486855 RepID=UPI0039E2D760
METPEMTTEFKIVIHGLPDAQCKGCKFTKLRLDRAGVPYEFIDLSLDENEQTREAIRSLGHMQAPYVLLSDGTDWTGLDPDKIDDAVAKYNRSKLQAVA